MGRIRFTGNQKAFEGSPSGIPDANSIQSAVKWTLDNTNLATKNMITLASLAKRDMFVPKRTTAPVDMGQFRGFPQITIDVEILDTYVIENETGNAGQVTFNLKQNNKVGYNYRLFVEVWSGDSFTPEEPDNPDSPSGNYKSNTFEVSAGVVLDQPYSFIFDEVIVDVFSGVAEFTMKITYTELVTGSDYVSNTVYINYNGSEISDSFRDIEFTVAPYTGTPTPIFPFEFTVMPIDTFSCNAVSTVDPLTFYSDSSSLGVNVGLSLSPIEPVSFRGVFMYVAGGETFIMNVRVNVGNGYSIITDYEECIPF
jgi:hypothetical protein